MAKLVIVRHGQSVWNLENKFTGWVDVDLTSKGEEEAKEAGRKLKGYRFDIAFSSELKRANRTLDFILNELEQEPPITKHKALNERMYGDLQGLDKTATAEKYGKEQVHIWRRSFDVPPPNGESLKDTAARSVPYYKENIEPLLKEGKNVICVAHGNSLRSLIMHIEDLGKEEILLREVPTGQPVVYDFDKQLRVKDKKTL